MKQKEIELKKQVKSVQPRVNGKFAKKCVNPIIKRKNILESVEKAKLAAVTDADWWGADYDTPRNHYVSKYYEGTEKPKPVKVTLIVEDLC